MSDPALLAQSRACRVDTHAHVFERGLPLTDGRRYAPDPEPSRQLGCVLDIRRESYPERVSIAPQVTF